MADQITFLFLSDTHGHVEPYLEWEGPASGRMLGGAANVRRLINELRSRPAGPTILLHGGDVWSDTAVQNATRGMNMLEHLNAWGVDAMTLGNHDYDYGVERLGELIQAARFPVLAANLISEDGSQPWRREPLVLERDGTRVAIIGLTYHNTPETTAPRNVVGLTFGDPFAALAERVTEAGNSADLVVALSHCGTAVDRILAERVSGLDLIVGSHSHELVPYQQIGETAYAQAGAHGGYVGAVTLRREGGSWQVVSGQVYPVEAGGTQVAGTVGSSGAASGGAASGTAGGRPPGASPAVAFAAEVVERRYKSPSPVDQWSAEVIRAALGVDICFLPGIGYGVPLLPGPVTLDDLTQLYAHDTRLWTCLLSGAEIRGVLEQSLWTIEHPDPMRRAGGLIQAGGLYWRHARGGDYWKRVLGAWLRPVFGSGTGAGYGAGVPGTAPGAAPGAVSATAGVGAAAPVPLEDDRLYRVAMPGLLAQGGHFQRAFLAARERRDTGIQLREFLLDHLASYGTIRRLPPNVEEVPG